MRGDSGDKIFFIIHVIFLGVSRFVDNSHEHTVIHHVLRRKKFCIFLDLVEEYLEGITWDIDFALGLKEEVSFVVSSLRLTYVYKITVLERPSFRLFFLGCISL